MLAIVRDLFVRSRARLRVLAWRANGYLRRSLWRISRFLVRAQSLLIPLAAVIAGLIVDRAVGSQLTPTLVGNFLVGTATLIGGFLTVAFALSVSLQQSVANLYSPQDLAEYSYGGRERGTFALLVSAVFGCLAFGLYCLSLQTFGASSLRTFCVALGFGSLGIALTLVEAQLRHGSGQLRPTAAIAFLRRTAERQMKRLDREARRLAEGLRLQRSVEPAEARAWAYRQLADTVGKLVVLHLSRLQEMALRLSDRGDSVAAGHALEAWSVVLRTYVDYRKDSSLVIPSDVDPTVPESDSQWILNRALEQLNDLGARFLRNSQLQNARAVVRVYNGLADVASAVHFLNRRGENPIVDQLGWYLKSYVEAATKHGDVDVPFAAIDVFTNIGVRSIEAGLSHAPYATCRQLDSIVTLLARAETSVFVERCIKAYTRLAWTLLTTPDAPDNFQPLIASLERTQSAVLLHWATHPAIDPTAHFWSTLRAPFEEMRYVVESFAAWFAQLPKERQARHRSSFHDCADQLYSFVRRSAEAATARNGYIDTLPVLIFAVVRTLVSLHNDPYDRSLEHARSWLYLLTWIAHNEKPFKDPNAVRQAAETAARAGLYFLARGMPDELILASVDTARSLAQRVIEDHAPSFGYDEPRSIAPLCFVAAFALKKRNFVVLHGAVNTIRQLSVAYEQKFTGATKDGRPVPPPSSVLREVLSLRKDLSEKDRVVGIVHPFLGDAMRLLSIADVDRIIWHIWRVVPKWSPIGKEIAERQALDARLLQVLKAKIAAAFAAEPDSQKDSTKGSAAVSSVKEGDAAAFDVTTGEGSA